jgi:hypothetical protein
VSRARKDPPVCVDAMRWLRERGWNLAPLTGQDAPALQAVAHAWALYGRADLEGSRATLRAIAALCDAMQPVVWPMARELAACALDWGHRASLWPMVCEASLRSAIDRGVSLPRALARREAMLRCAMNLSIVRQPDEVTS